MIILNEKEYAEECLRNKEINDNPFVTLSILAKYYYHHLGYRRKKITQLLTDFISKYYERYDCNKASWDESIEKLAKNAGKYALFEIDGVWITKNELLVISSIKDKVLERLAFTLLCLAKLGNLQGELSAMLTKGKPFKNNGWVNLDTKDVFSLARIACSVSKRYEKLNALHEMNLLEFPKKLDNLSCRVTYVDDDSEKELFISDFKELGYEYLKYCGEDFIRCRECGRLIRNNKFGNKKYCSDCAAYTPKIYKTITCVDCGKEVEVKGNNKRTIRCADCQRKKTQNYDRSRKNIKT